MKPNQDFTEQEFKDIQVESHQFHKTYMEVMETYENKESKLEEQSIGLFNVFLTSVGVIAGFGFAALGNVRNYLAFFISEVLLLSIIIYGLWILFSYKKSKGKFYQFMGDAWHNVLSPRLESYKKFLTLKITKKQLFDELNKDDENLFNFKPESNIKVIDLDKHFLTALVLLVLGVALLILSFIGLGCSHKKMNYSIGHNYLQRNFRYK